jgi:hypothetical protein
VLEVVKEAVLATKPIRFEGNNYSSELVEEARRPGAAEPPHDARALAELVRPESIEFLAKAKVFSKAESEARYHVKLERYVKDIEIESEALKSLVANHVLPAAYKQRALLAGAGSSRSVGSALDRIDGAIDDLTLASRTSRPPPSTPRPRPREEGAHLRRARRAGHGGEPRGRRSHRGGRGGRVLDAAEVQGDAVYRLAVASAASQPPATARVRAGVNPAATRAVA